MRLTLIQDGTVGDVAGEAQISDHPEKGELADALKAIGEAAQEKLIDGPAREAKAAEDAAKAEADAAAAGASGAKTASK